MYQQEFIPLIDEATRKCKERFSKRLLAVYIGGSVAANEAVAGESDLDYFAILEDELGDADKAWIEETASELDRVFAACDGVHINVLSVDGLSKDKFALFILKHNSVLHCGRDALPEIERTKSDIYEPDKAIAKERLAFARQCLADASAGKCPRCMEKIPENTYFAARKFARYFILVEGAYFLMARNEFETFRQERVVEQLRENCAGFDGILDLSLAVLKAPLEAKVAHADYIGRISPFVEWMFDGIANA